MLNRPADSTEVGEIVASVRDYASAQKTVSKLIAGEVPARDITIVGQSVRTIERVTGRLGYATAARSGAINGILIGLFLSAIFVLGNPDAPIQLFLGFVLVGVAIGMILSLVTFSLVRRRRDFASVTQVAADHYEVTVLPASLAKAREVIGTQRPAPVRPPVNLDEPPRYGERVKQGQSVQQAAAPVPPVIPPRPADPVPQYGERIADAPENGAQVEPARRADDGNAADATNAPGSPAEGSGRDAS